MFTVDCKWINSNLEAYCCERLSSAAQQLPKSHIDSCPACTAELRSLDALDPLIKDVFRSRMAVARAPRHVRPFLPAAAFAGSVAVVVLLMVLFQVPTIQNDNPVAPPTAQLQSVEPENTNKQPDTVAVERAKPADGSAAEPVFGTTAPNQNYSAAFAVIDAAGYVRTLEDYRGYVLLFGVWNPDDARTAAAFEELYRTFSPDTSFRIVAVSTRPGAPRTPATFPVVYNHESRLLDAQESEFVVIDEAGVERLRGSLRNQTADIIRDVRRALPN